MSDINSTPPQVRNWNAPANRRIKHLLSVSIGRDQAPDSLSALAEVCYGFLKWLVRKEELLDFNEGRNALAQNGYMVADDLEAIHDLVREMPCLRPYLARPIQVHGLNRIEAKAEFERVLDWCQQGIAMQEPAAPLPVAPSQPAKTQLDEGGKPPADPAPKPNGPFGVDGFRFAGVEVKFGRAVKQYGLVVALWDAQNKRPTEPRAIEDVIAEVWGDENKTEDSTFRQLCTDTRRRFEGANCPLNIQPLNGKVHLTPR